MLSTGFDYTGIDCIVLGVSTASIALYYQIIGRATRIDPEKTDALIVDLGGNVERFGRVEDITFEQGKMWRMFGTGGRLLHTPDTDVHNQWSEFVRQNQHKEIEAIIKDENLNRSKTLDFIKQSFRDGEVRESGDRKSVV